MSRMSATKTPVSKIPKQRSVDPDFSSSNPFDSDPETETKTRHSRVSSAPVISKGNLNNSPLTHNEDERGGASYSSSAYAYSSADKSRFRNDFRDSGGFDNQSVQELEGYAVYKSEETTQKVNGCLKIAEEMREDATKTLITLHQQGEQITRTHHDAADIEIDLSRSEKLLGSLGGIFSKKWKPKKSHKIKGPVLTRDDSFKRKGNHLEQRERLGLPSNPQGRSNPRQFTSEPTSALEKVEVEKHKQDDALSDLSNVLGQLKEMAVDMGSEIERQTTALGHMENDVEEVNYRVKGANARTRRLLGK